MWTSICDIWWFPAMCLALFMKSYMSDEISIKKIQYHVIMCFLVYTEISKTFRRGYSVQNIHRACKLCRFYNNIVQLQVVFTRFYIILKTTLQWQYKHYLMYDTVLSSFCLTYLPHIHFHHRIIPVHFKPLTAVFSSFQIISYVMAHDIQYCIIIDACCNIAYRVVAIKILYCNWIPRQS